MQESRQEKTDKNTQGLMQESQSLPQTDNSMTTGWKAGAYIL